MKKIKSQTTSFYDTEQSISFIIPIFSIIKKVITCHNNITIIYECNDLEEEIKTIFIKIKDNEISLNEDTEMYEYFDSFVEITPILSNNSTSNQLGNGLNINIGFNIITTERVRHIFINNFKTTSELRNEKLDEVLQN